VPRCCLSRRGYAQESKDPYGGENMLMMYDRWNKLQKALYLTKDKSFDISKIPDIYDSIKYDYIHNSHLGIDFSEV
jgi:inositol-hexakisphosphate/diphosphoinositol-pentakisphosphate 1-kinase